ncbi:MAG: DUF1501 domain-containing protein [Planctomycetota bacterium]|nr:DUF1501 domain-containing protein [Planctomycetota bacterium]MDP6763114.1 DUF1501 domain-containing protein [Planctomycetota bacterium]
METKRDASSTTDPCACGEFGALTRRGFLGSSAAVGAALGTAGMAQVALGAGRGTERERDVLVLVFLRGGMDGLTAVVPHGDPDLYTARPNLAVPPPGQPDGALDLDGFFGLAPSCAPLVPLYDAGDLAIVHATGSTDPTRSHFSAMRFMETATPNMGPTTINDGWLGRHLQTSTAVGAGDLRAAALQSTLTRALVGGPGALPVKDPSDFPFPGPADIAPQLRSALEIAYAGAHEPLAGAAASSLGAIDLLAGVDFENYQPENGAVYPGGPFAAGLVQIATMIKADIGLECVELDISGWDHHSGMGPLNGILAAKLADLSAGLAAFHTDLGSAGMARVTMVVMTEFGRRVAENGSAGTDHGHGGAMFVIGGNVNGGQVHTQWPGLDPGSLGNGDLVITTDYRDVLAEIVQLRLGNSSLDVVFPQHTPQFPGIVA